MVLKNDVLIKEFIKVKGYDEDFSSEQIKKIVFGPWRFLKHQMESGELESVRIKYFGLFKVYPTRAKGFLAELELRLKEGTINIKDYNRIKPMLEKFINKHKNKKDE